MSDVRILNNSALLYQHKYQFDLDATNKISSPRELIRRILGYFNKPITEKLRYELISTTRYPMKVYYFLWYVQAAFDKEWPVIHMKDNSSKYKFMDACENVFDDIVREVNEWPNPIGGHMQLYLFQHWDTFQQLGERLRKNNFYIDDVTEVWTTFRNPMLSHADVMSELVTLTSEKYSPEWLKKSLESQRFIKD